METKAGTTICKPKQFCAGIELPTRNATVDYSTIASINIYIAPDLILKLESL